MSMTARLEGRHQPSAAPREVVAIEILCALPGDRSCWRPTHFVSPRCSGPSTRAIPRVPMLDDDRAPCADIIAIT
jgi:hypothetical protein